MNRLFLLLFWEPPEKLARFILRPDPLPSRGRTRPGPPSRRPHLPGEGPDVFSSLSFPGRPGRRETGSGSTPANKKKWQKVLNRNSYDEAKSVVQTADGGYLVVGETDLTDPLTSSIGAVKLSPGGEVVWQRRWVGVGNSGGMFNAAATGCGG